MLQNATSLRISLTKAQQNLSRKPPQEDKGKRRQQQHLWGGGGASILGEEILHLAVWIIAASYLNPTVPFTERKDKRERENHHFKSHRSDAISRHPMRSIFLRWSSTFFAELRFSVSVLATALSGGGGGVCSPDDPASSTPPTPPQSIPSSRKFREGGAAPGALSLGDASPSRNRFFREGMGILLGSGEF